MKKKFLAAILAAAVMVTSIQLPPMEVRAEGAEVSDLEALVAECDVLAQNEGLYIKEAWEAFEAELTEAKEILADGNVTEEALQTAYSELETVKNGLANNIRIVTTGTDNGEDSGNVQNPEKDNIYNANDRFQFPDIDEVKILEMEYLFKVDDKVDNDWTARVSESTEASNGKYLDGIDGGDKAILYYNAPRTGVYTAVLRYQSGSERNCLVWSEANTKIENGEVGAGATSVDSGFHETQSFTFVVTEAGDGILTFTGKNGSGNGAPRLDKLEIRATALDLSVNKVYEESQGAIVGAGVVRQNSQQTFTITPKLGYEVKTISVNEEVVDLTDGSAVSVNEAATDGKGAVLQVTVPTVEADANGEFTIEAEFDYFNYSKDNRFEFPTEMGQNATLEMEYLEQYNNTENDALSGGNYPLVVKEATWDEQAIKFLNSLNYNDTAKLYYVAERPGTYTAVLTYRSGSDANGIVWEENEAKIIGMAGDRVSINENATTVSAGAGDPDITQTVTFKFNVEETGEGCLTFRGKDSGNAPQMDKIVITADPLTYSVIKTVVTEEGEEKHGEITGADTVTEGEDATFTITPDEGYAVENVTVNGENKGPVESVTVENVMSDLDVSATFMEEAKMEEYSVVLQGNIVMKFRMKLSNEVLINDARVIFTLGNGEPDEPIPVSGEQYDAKTGFYIFEYGVPVKDMDTNVRVQVVLGSDNNRECFNKVYTVNGYVAGLKQQGCDEKTTTLVNAMSTFGDYAEIYFGEGNLEDLVLSETELEDLNNHAAVITTGGIANNYYGSSLLLKENTIIRHYFKADISDENVPDGYEKGAKEGGFYYIESEGIAAHELNKPHEITVTTDLGTVAISYSPLSYAQSALTSDGIDDKLKNVMRAMYLYHKAAQEYLGEE